MTENEFNALLNLIQAHVVHAHLTENRQYDAPHMDRQQMELQSRIQMAREVLVPRKLRPAQHQEEDDAA